MNSCSGWRAVQGLKSRGCGGAGMRGAPSPDPGAPGGAQTPASRPASPSPPPNPSEVIEDTSDSMPLLMRLDHLVRIRLWSLEKLLLSKDILFRRQKLTQRQQPHCVGPRESCADDELGTMAPKCKTVQQAGAKLSQALQGRELAPRHARESSVRPYNATKFLEGDGN